MPRSSDQPGPSPRSRGEGLRPFKLTRRSALTGAALLGAGAAAERLAGGSTVGGAGEPAPRGGAIQFRGRHQAGIATLQQAHLLFAAFDLNDHSPTGLSELLREWSVAADALTAGRQYGGDPGEAVGLGPSRLTLTFGLGPRLFTGRLAQLRPPRLDALPPFAGELLDPDSSGGDLCVQACAEDPQVAFHALHVLDRIAAGSAALRWSQPGFLSRPSAGTPRNLLGFKDGTNNLRVTDSQTLERFVWIQPGDGPSWLTGGSYLIVRRIEMVFATWDAAGLAEQERTIGRRKRSGAPLGGKLEHDRVNLSARDGHGGLAIPPHAHIRLASAAQNGGRRILRRGYSYSRGSTIGPVDRGGHQLDGGLFFIGFVRDPGQFITIQRRLATSDALSAFTVHTASAIFACPPGATPGGFVGQALFS